MVVILLSCVFPATASPGNKCLECHPVHYAGQGSCVFCHHGNQRTSRKGLAHSGLIRGRYAGFTNSSSAEVVSGGKLAEKAACRRCHVLAGTGNRLAANLDTLLWTSPPEAIRSALVNPALYMPDFNFPEKDLDRLVTAVLAGGLKAGKALKEPPHVVHFSDADAAKLNVFTKNCGSCHKLLSKRDGGLGVGIVAPNLSGLLSQFYPHTFEGNKIWDKERLKRWLKNPRAIRNNAVMRPIPLKPEDWDELLKTVASS
jgi:mono/diheme cytochrome c family protein